MYNLNKTIMRKRFTLALLSLLLVPLGMMADSNVTVSPSTGSLIVALTEGTEVGFTGGWGAMWRHEQLPLSFTVADYVDLTEGGEIARPAGNLYDKNGQLVVLGGQSPLNGYMVLSLPKGYRFTGYKMVLVNDNIGVEFPGYGTIGGIQKSFYETNKNFDYENYIARAETADHTWTMAASNEPNKEYVIERTSLTDDDMSNQLYFCLRLHAQRSYAVLTIKSFEVYFTAEGTFSAGVKPVGGDFARSVVQAPFKTSKMDIGDLKRETKTVNGVTRTFFAYNYNNVKDLEGYTYLYQSDAVVGGEPVEGDETKHIYPVVVDNQNQYAFGEGTYFVETPVTIHTQSGLEAPVGYRIVGAKFTPLWGTETQAHTETRTNNYITYTSGGTTYYLNDQLRFTTNKFAWNQDTYGNIYATEGRYLSCTGSGRTRTLTWSNDVNGDWNLRLNNNYIYWTSWTYGTLYLKGRTDGATAQLTTGNDNRAQWGSVQETVTIPAYKPGTYTLNVFDKTGSNPHSIEISGATDSDLNEPYDMGKLNNDAVKFSISNLESGKQALVAITLEMQALNPYIKSMDIVCENPNKELKLSQTFTASDFSVSGGKFKFYIPADRVNEDMTFSFKNLHSDDGDETYGGTGFARYSFVSSPYFETVDGNGDNGLYDNAYDPETPSTTKIYADNVGNIRFKFNNAEDLVASSQGTGHLEENPFSVSEYLGSDDPDGTDEKGAFNQIVLNASVENQKSDIAYLFTADETRYNIAPTTAWQHRSYAFYRMDVELEAKNYTPELTWTKLYDENKTCYADQDENGKDVDTFKSMWGVKLGTLDEKNNKVKGHLSVAEIVQALQAAFESAGDNHPTSQDQILYVDGSELNTIVSSQAITVEQLNGMLAPNSLFFLPENMTSKADNIAYKTTSGSFRAGKNIELTDRKPFFSPYDIQVGADPNYAMYTRNVTWQKNGKATNASLIVPFQIAVDNEGKHDDGEGNVFYVYKIQSDGNCLSDKPQSEDDYIHMLPLEGMKTTEPNVPYVVSVKDAPDDANVSFVVKQTGALLKATTEMDSNYEFAGATGTGTDEKASVTFSMKGSYSGQKISKANRNVFYFAKNMFFDIKSLSSWITDLYVYPFRGYFDYTTTTGGAKTFNSLDIFFGENFEVDGIEAVESEPIAVDADAPVYDVQGRMISTSVRELAGKKLARGIYVVNGVKFTVK